MLSQGFIDDVADFAADEASLLVEEAYPGCRVLPVSKLTVNQTGIDAGDVTNLQTRFVVRVFSDTWYLCGC